MTDSLSDLNDINLLRSLSQNFEIDVLEDMVGNLLVVLDERRVEEALLNQEPELKNTKLEYIRKKLLENGMEPIEFIFF
ncbi:hypothetical protein AF42_03468 [Citrobacter freundii MGH 56]|nr:hypothetical protein AF42_03468 [Citrobacter freundii MGH 56]